MYDSATALSAATLFADGDRLTLPADAPNPHAYEEIIVLFSGGKDSLACCLYLLDLGVPASRIEIHHHLVDGKEGSTLFDWPVTPAYCKAFAKAFGFRYVETWKQGGFEREMCRDSQPTAPIVIPDGNGGTVAVGGKGPADTRLKFPQVSMSLSTRWCSAYLKCDVFARYVTNSEKFKDGKKRLVVSGERAEESPSRARYAEFEPHTQDLRDGRVPRYIDHWRAVHKWSEAQIWEIIARYRIRVHYAYAIGYSRCSCLWCIFQNDDSVATGRFLAPETFNQQDAYERKFGMTIHRTKSIVQRADRGTVFPDAKRFAKLAMQEEFTESIFVDEWKLPPGAFKANGGCF